MTCCSATTLKCSRTSIGRCWLRHGALSALFSTGDVVQEVFLSVVRDVDSMKGATEASFAAFLATLVRNRIVDSIRFHEAMRRGARRSRGIDDEADMGAASDAEPPVNAARAEEVERFCAQLAQTPPRERALLMGRIEHEHPFAQLAADLGYPSEDAARKAFYAAQARLLLRLRRAGIGDEDGK
jgi:RNA polymerase sigma factor (sigma-70 family)